MMVFAHRAALKQCRRDDLAAQITIIEPAIKLKMTGFKSMSCVMTRDAKRDNHANAHARNHQCLIRLNRKQPTSADADTKPPNADARFR